MSQIRESLIKMLATHYANGNQYLIAEDVKQELTAFMWDRYHEIRDRHTVEFIAEPLFYGNPADIGKIKYEFKHNDTIQAFKGVESASFRNRWDYLSAIANYHMLIENADLTFEGQFKAFISMTEGIDLSELAYSVLFSEIVLRSAYFAYTGNHKPDSARIVRYKRSQIERFAVDLGLVNSIIS